MNTTELFVEIIVIGVGADIWLGFLVLTVFGYSWVPWNQLTSLISLIPFLAITYVLGIAVDRIADQLYGKWDKKLRWQYFTNNVEYHQARTLCYTKASDKIIDLFEYGRSRLRISRSWSLNFLLIALFSTTFALSDSVAWSFGLKAKVIIISICILVGFGAFNVFAWRKLAKNDYKRLAEMKTFLSSHP